MKDSLRTLAHGAWEAILADPRATKEMRAAQFPNSPKILGSSEKIVKGEKRGILTAVAYLAPSTESGRDVCPWATEECAAACLGHSSGRMIYSSARNSRIWKTALYLYARSVFWRLVRAEIAAHVRKAKRLGFIPAIRLNGTSDIVAAWEIASSFPTVTFYDYTKSKARALKFAKSQLPANYHLTFSRSGHNDNDCLRVLRLGGNVAVVFSTKRGAKLPTHWNGYQVIDADETDARFQDPPGTVSGLRFKGNKAALAGKFLVTA